MKLSELKGQGIADRMTGTYFADTPHLDKFHTVAESIREADEAEALKESALPKWEVTIAEGVFVRRTVHRSWSAAMLLESISCQLMREEDERDEALTQVTVTIGRAK